MTILAAIVIVPTGWLACRLWMQAAATVGVMESGPATAFPTPRTP
jgi:hypothetical protein